MVVPGLKLVVQGSTCGDVFETAGQRLQQLRLLSRRAQEYARLVHPILPRGRAAPFAPAPDGRQDQAIAASVSASASSVSA